MKLSLKNKTIGTMMFLSIFTMYIEIIPGIETQPFLIITVTSLYFVTLITKIKTKFINLFIYLLLLLILINYIFSLFYFNYSFIEVIKYSMPLIYFIYFFNKGFVFNTKLLDTSLNIIFILYISLFLKIPIISESLILFQQKFIPRFHMYELVRSFGLLTPEASYFSMTLVFVYIIFDIYKINNIKNKFIIILLILLAKSALGYLLIFIYVFLNKFSINFIKNYKFIILITSFIMLVFSTDNRIVQLFTYFINYDNTSLLNLLILADPSFGSRIAINLISLTSPLYYPIGIGFGNLYHVWINIGHTLNINFFGNEILKNLYVNNSKFMAQAYFPNIISSLGFYSIPFLIFLFYPLVFFNKLEKKYKIIFSVVILLFFIQVQATNPIPWILLALIYREGYHEKNINQLISYFKST